MSHDKDRTLTHSAGTGLLALLGMFGRCADDVARVGVRGVDDVGRACANSSDDVGAMMWRSGDDLYRAPQGFPTKSYTDGLKFQPSPPRVAVYDVDDVVGVAPSVVQNAVSTSIRYVAQAERELEP